MIRPLRARHRWLMPVCGMAALAVLIGGVAARHEPAVIQTPIAGTSLELPELPQSARLLGEREMEPARLRVQWFAVDRADTAAIVRLTPRGSHDPGPIGLFWSAQWIGAFDGDRERLFRLPEATSDHGRLRFFSLREREWIGSLRLDGTTTR